MRRYHFDRLRVRSFPHPILYRSQSRNHRPTPLGCHQPCHTESTILLRLTTPLSIQVEYRPSQSQMKSKRLPTSPGEDLHRPPAKAARQVKDPIQDQRVHQDFPPTERSLRWSGYGVHSLMKKVALPSNWANSCGGSPCILYASHVWALFRGCRRALTLLNAD